MSMAKLNLHLRSPHLKLSQTKLVREHGYVVCFSQPLGKIGSLVGPNIAVKGP
jgi:hypothetical protein